jgi:hypothetical protein
MNQINYKDILDQGFTIEECVDQVYHNTYGYPYCIITKNLTDTIYLDWEKETRLCYLVRIDNHECCNIKAKRLIKDVEDLKDTIKFYA